MSPTYYKTDADKADADKAEIPAVVTISAVAAYYMPVPLSSRHGPHQVSINTRCAAFGFI